MSDDVASTNGAIFLPRPVSVQMQNFSLYSNAPNIDADLGEGVFCLAGANGLGKSTFLSALNFALTGVVADPNRRFDSVREYYRHSLNYSSDYFSGRISSADRDLAQVSVEFILGDSRLAVTRGMFEPLALRKFTLQRPGAQLEVVSEAEGGSEDIHARYVSSFLEISGLDTFAQFVFLQHHVLTFDERRHLLFWDDRISQAALFIAFQVSSDTADRADQLRRTVEKADSLARNLQWQATDTRKKLKELEGLAADAADEAEGTAEYEVLVSEVEEATGRLRGTQSALRDQRLRISELSTAEAEARRSYDDFFTSSFGGRRPVNTHPLVEEALTTSHCGVCGSLEARVKAEVQAHIKDNTCPLCGLPEATLDAPDVDGLNERAERLAALGVGLDEARREHGRLEEKLAGQEGELSQLSERLLAFEERTELEVGLEGSVDRGVEAISRRYKAQIADFLDRKKVERTKRDTAKRELKRLQDQLAIAYSVAEDEFVPEFTELARAFLGLDLDIELSRQGGAMQLLLSVESTRRRAHEALSESQRFFVDIALRMALARQIVNSTSPVCLYIDTPEGSLDIAYESRAGSMFADFVRKGNQLLITANINTSQLLHRLASDCGPEAMVLLRMTEWTSLSEVQAEEEDLFDQAYEAIEAALSAGGRG